MASEDLQQRLDEARAQLMRIPGVVGVGFGFKQRSGITTNEVSLRVYVREKKPASDLSPEELIPDEVCGLRTDVLTVLKGKKASCLSTEAKSPLVGGIHVANMRTWNADGSGYVNSGTLGFFATKNGETSRDRYVLLSNNHVLGHAGAAVGATIYQPQLRIQDEVPVPAYPNDLHAIGSIDNIGKQDHVAYAYPGESSQEYFVDCATAKISTCYSSWCDTNCGTKLTNAIRNLEVAGSNSIAGVARVGLAQVDPARSDLPPYEVYKVGYKTGKTVGRVVGVAEPVEDTDTNEIRRNCMWIENLGPNCEGGTAFADHGDSGSVIVNGDRRIVGLLFLADAPGSGGAAAVHIAPVLDQLGITMISASNRIAGDASTTARETLVVGAGDASGARADELRRRILDSERGLRARELVDRHRDEVVHLVNRVRQVTVAWHRVHGPEFLAHVVEASRRSTHRVPAEIEGVSRAEAAARMLESFSRFGSAALREDVDLHGDHMRALLDAANDIEELAGAIDRSPDTALQAGPV